MLKEKMEYVKSADFAKKMGLMLLIIAAGYSSAPLFQKMENARRGTNSDRTKDFATYVMDDINSAVARGLDSADIKHIQDVYRDNPQLLAEYIDKLVSDSTFFAHAIERDSRVIKSMDKQAKKTIRFEDALNMIKQHDVSDGRLDPADHDYAQRLLKHDIQSHQNVVTQLAAARQSSQKFEK